MSPNWHAKDIPQSMKPDVGVGSGAGGGTGGKDKEPPSIAEQLKENLNKIGTLIRKNEYDDARNLLIESRKLAKEYQPGSEVERSALLFFIDRLKLKAKALYYKWDEDENLTEVGGKPEENFSEQAEPVKVDEGVELNKNKLLGEINYVWETTLNTTYRHLQISQVPELMQHVEKIKAGVEKLFGENSNLVKLFDLSINIRDLASANAGEDKHLCADNVENLLELLKASKLTKQDADNFKNIVLLEDAENKKKYTVRDVFNFICEDLLLVRDQRGYEYKGKYYNFAKNGDGEGVLKEIVKAQYPFLKEYPSFVLDSIINQVIIEGVRYDAFAPYYTYYQASPIFGMNAEWYSATNPLISILYSIASSPPIPGGKTLLQVVRFPEASHYRDEEGKQLKTIDLSPNSGLNRDSPAYAKEYSKLNRFTKYKEAMASRDYGRNETREEKTHHAWRTLVNVRNSLCEIVSPSSDIGYVTINPDFQFLPSLHDVYEGRWMRQNPKTNSWKFEAHELKNLSVQDYIEIQQRFGEFLDLVDKPPLLEDRMDLGSAMKKAYSATSKFKAIFLALNVDENTPENHVFYDFLQIVRLMYVIYIKKLFNKYIQLPANPGWANWRQADKEFLGVMRTSLEDETGTIPEAIAGYLLDEVIIPAQEGRGEYSSTFKIIAATEPWITRQIKKGTEYAKLFERWVKEPTVAEKDPNKA